MFSQLQTESNLHSIIQLHGCHMGLHYLTFMRRNSKEKKNQLTPVRMMNSVGMNSKNVVYNVSIFKRRCSRLQGNDSGIKEAQNNQGI
jgi:hypothetical protein